MPFEQQQNSSRGNTTSVVLAPPLWAVYGCLPGSDSHEAQVQLITRAPFCVGRRRGNDLRLRTGTVSGHHAQFVQFDDALVLRDLSSTNGTFVNGTRITEDVFLDEGDFVQFADVEVQVIRNPSLADESTSLLTRTSLAIGDFQSCWTWSNFERLFDRDGLTTVYQPIFEIADGTLFAWEALARSEVEGLETPAPIFSTAEQLDAAARVSRVCRERAVESSFDLPGPQRLFVNTHPDEDLLTQVAPSVARLVKEMPGRRLVVELHESTVLDVETALQFKQLMAAQDVEIACDDIGTGEDRLVQLLTVAPDFVKFDRSVISQLPRMMRSQRAVLKSFVTALNNIGSSTLAEGVETEDELECCRKVGFQMAQGWFVGHPAPASQL